MQHGDLLKMRSEKNDRVRKRRSHERAIGEEHRTRAGCRKYTRQRVEEALLRSRPISVLVTQSCLTLCDPIDGSPPGSPVPGILQARALEQGAIAFSISRGVGYYTVLRSLGGKKVKVKVLNYV